MSRAPNALLFCLLIGVCGWRASPEGALAQEPPTRTLQQPQQDGQGNGQDNGPTNGIPVGIVDFMRVLAAYPRAIAERKKIDEWLQQRQDVIDAEERKAQEIKLRRDDLLPNTVERAYKDHELRLKLQDIDGLRQIFRLEQQRRIDEYYAMVYDDMRQAVEIVARNRKVSMVMRAHLDPEKGSEADKARELERRVVWFASEEIDLTADVIKLLQAPLPKEATGAESSPKDAERRGTQDSPKENTGG